MHMKHLIKEFCFCFVLYILYNSLLIFENCTDSLGLCSPYKQIMTVDAGVNLLMMKLDLYYFQNYLYHDSKDNVIFFIILEVVDNLVKNPTFLEFSRNSEK